MFRKVITLLLLFACSILPAQNFGGIINFKKQVGKDSTNYDYYVKGDKVRFDEYTPGTKTLSSCFILDIKANTMIFIDPDRKCWGKRVRGEMAVGAAGCVAATSAEMKEMFGYKCSEQVIKNVADSTEISYFITPGKFSFFMPMLRQINSMEKLSTYLFSANMPDGSMPLLAIEKDLKGNEKERLEVTSIEEKAVPDSKFLVPKGYKEIK